MHKTPSLDTLILKIHAAPLDPDGWGQVAQDVAALCEAERAAVLRVAQDPAHAPVMISSSLDPEAVREYFEQWSPHDVLYHGAVQHGRVKPGLVSTDEQLVERQSYYSCAYYNDYLRRFDIKSQLNVCLTGAEPSLGCSASALTVYRGSAREAFSRTTVEVLQRLAPHLSMAARTTWRLEAAALAAPLYRQALDEIQIPFFALDTTGRLALVNGAGEGLIRTQRWVRSLDGALAASGLLIEAQAFRQALTRLRLGRGTTLLLTDAHTREQAVMTTVPLPGTSPIAVAGKAIAGFVWIQPCSSPVTSVDKVGQLFQLTHAEGRLLQRLVEGASLRDAAAALGISDNTARSQLKSVFRKTGRHTQGQLLMLASRMATIR